jgi:hypothetical protein
MGLFTKILATVLVIVVVIPGTYLALDAVLVNAKIADLPGGFYRFSVTDDGTIDTGQGDSTTMDIVDRTIKISYTNGMAKSALATRTLSTYLSDGSLYETLTATDSAGITTSTKTYKSTDKYWVHDGTTNEAIEITIPRMMRSTWQGTIAANPISLEGFAVNTYSDLLAKGATTLADDYEYNYTDLGKTGTFSYSWQAVTDDCGYVSSERNPDLKLNGMFNAQRAYVFIIVSGGDWDKALITGFNSYTTGAANVFYKQVPDDALCMDKDGSTYVIGKDGTGSIGIPFDFTGMSSATNTTMQVYIFYNADPVYASYYHATGATASQYGAHAVQAMETALELGA